MGHLENDLDYGLDVVRSEAALNRLAEQAHDIALAHGFYDDYKRIYNAVMEMAPEDSGEAATNFSKAINWLKSSAEQAAIARMHSELSEWLEGIRKHQHKKDEHCPEFLSAEIEAADVIIRVLDTCKYRGYRIGEAVIAKMQYNAGRPYKHGKNS